MDMAAIENKLDNLTNQMGRVINQLKTLQELSESIERSSTQNTRKRHRDETVPKSPASRTAVSAFYCDTPIVIQLQTGSAKSIFCVLLGWKRWMYAQPIPVQGSNQLGKPISIRAQQILTPKDLTRTNKETYFQPATMPKDLKDLQAKYPSAIHWEGRLTRDQFFAHLNASPLTPNTPPPPCRIYDQHPTTTTKQAMVADTPSQTTVLKPQFVPIDIDADALECPILE
jgi:hypothetical protein